MLQCSNETARKRLGSLLWCHWTLKSFRHCLGAWTTVKAELQRHFMQSLWPFLAFPKYRKLPIEKGDHRSGTFRTDIGVSKGAVSSPLVFNIFVAEMFTGIEAEKFKFAFYGNLLLSAETKLSENSLFENFSIVHQVAAQNEGRKNPTGFNKPNRQYCNLAQNWKLNSRSLLELQDSRHRIWLQIGFQNPSS